MAPSTFRRLARFRALLRRHTEAKAGWSSLAAELGYADQAHLIHDFRDFSGMTPNEWQRHQGQPVAFLQDGQIAAF
jgi:AraC-like DNA-binding protein